MRLNMRYMRHIYARKRIYVERTENGGKHAEIVIVAEYAIAYAIAYYWYA